MGQQPAPGQQGPGHLGPPGAGPGFTAPAGYPPHPGAVPGWSGQPPSAPYATGWGADRPAAAPQRPSAPRRPSVITVSLVLIVTASMLWMAELALVWLVVQVGREQFGYQGTEGALFHILERFHLSMVEGLAWVLFGYPLAATVLAFFLLARRAWPRIVISLLGVAAIVTTVLMLPDNLRLVLPGAVYVLFSCALLWVPPVTRWISAAPDTDR